MKSLWIPLLAMLATPALAQPKPRTSEAGTIIVTGQRLSETERALKDCLARNCPPDEDINATLTHVENLFVAGEYRPARTTLLASLKRNGDEARNYPEPVADLYRANGRVAAHLGFEKDYYRSIWSVLRALKAGIPQQDHRHFRARFEIAEMMSSVRGPRQAQIVYDSLARDAREAERKDIAALAELRSSWLDYLVTPAGTAKQRLIALSKSTEPATRTPALAAKILLARIARNEDEKDATDELIRDLAGMGFDKPTLLYSPRWQLVQQNNFAKDPDVGAGSFGANGVGFETTNVLTLESTDTFEEKWIDVGYWIEPSGRVVDLEVLRNSGETGWAKPLLGSIEGRIYSPTLPERGGTYRIERYTYTSPFEKRTGTRILQRSASARVEYLDLTLEPKNGS